MIYKAIPCWHQLDTSNVGFIENHEIMIDINIMDNKRIICEPQYYNQCVPGAIKECYVRKTVYELLLVALEFLPQEYNFKIYDAWRPYKVQKFLYDEQVRKLCEQGLKITEAQEKASKYVSYPSKSNFKPFVHSTGGAIDLTIIDAGKNELNMGTKFDDFSSRAATDSYENSQNLDVKRNRRLLYNAMIQAGFTNYPSEWWHYDYGNSFWAAEKKINVCQYAGISEI